MNEQPQSLWSRSWKGWRALAIWTLVLASVAVIVGVVARSTTRTEFERNVPLLGGILLAAVVVLVVCVRWLCCWRNLRRSLVGLAVLVTLIAAFYAEENWRGKRAWEQCKRDLAVKGELLDWTAYIPAPIPDDENIIKAPKMTEWFIKPKPSENPLNELSAKFGPRTQPENLKRKDAKEPILIARGLRAPADTAATDGTDAVIRFGAPDTSDQLRKFVADKIGPYANSVRGDGTLLRQPLDQIKPGRIRLQADAPFNAVDVARLLPTNTIPADLGRLRVEADAGDDSFRILLAVNSTVTAEDYLSASERCVPDLDLIREALKRPRIRMDDDYQLPFDIPIKRFVVTRNVVQAAAQRAQCYLLLGRSEQAFCELSLGFEMRRLLAAKPVMVIAVMVDAAVSGLYVNTIKDGLRLQVWREPELIALQKRLQQIDLPSALVESLHTEGAAARHTLETSSARQIREHYVYRDSRSSMKEKLTNPWFLLFTFAPRGWIQQNFAASALAKQSATEAFDVERWIIKPGAPEAANREIERIAAQQFPYKILAASTLSNLTRATRTAVRNQTLVNQGLIVCGLERYYIARGSYPDSLNALVPQFVEKLPPDVIGGQPLKYRRTDDGQFALYSVGWNERDDGGTPGKDVETGDWVWATATQ